jgi:hypothetical protein
MGQIVPFTREIVRLNYIDGGGVEYKMEIDLSGPTINAVKSVGLAVERILEDGGKITKATFGTMQGHEFREETRRRVPLFVDGWRRASAFIRA